MSEYGILNSANNTGLDSEILLNFSTPLSIVSNQPSFVQDTMNLGRKASNQNVQRWEIEANFEPTNGSTNYLTHSVSNGYGSVFGIRMPQPSNALRTKYTNPYSHGWPSVLALVSVGSNPYGSSLTSYRDYQANENKLRVINLTGASLTMYPGEFISFSETGSQLDTKVYLVTAVSVAPSITSYLPSGVTAGSYYSVDITISPSLRKEKQMGTAAIATPSVFVNYGDSVTMYAMYDNAAVLGMKFVDGVLSDPGSIKLIEAVNY
jgi:hypothetical protein